MTVSDGRELDEACPSFYGYIALPDTDHDKDDLSNSGSAAAAATDCAKLPACLGFNANGWMKSSVAPLRTVTSICFYTKIPGATTMTTGDRVKSALARVSSRNGANLSVRCE
ncbi:hypothetical protein VOLCADRAFT_98961 [Volvox carteri f. nagariensis]|uniref:Uncharacterized protein n=1 Tax=Volvox carteri f. nagariensis TaxID=3068 RepID=D8UGQ4_VOLCA|nr:uncharacterized protein VOLCADRAFT_98961 [Volvox carteri f. nagariensis]EFJ41088.1 hypothetical protein VOLCADRAFT_98961 [Volvox carteri f. nagariensis]|eukprot:XP_002957851.1 hypothetical protein VOLCADRAFT_98961 [Volvox carteri f. nagariensis]